MNFLIPQSKDLLQMPILGFDDKECLLFSSSIIHLNTWLVPWLAGRIHNLHSAHVKLSKFKFYWIAEYNVTSSIKSFVEDHHNKKKTFLIEQNGPFLWQVALSSSCVVCPPQCPPHMPAHNIWFFWKFFFLYNLEFLQLQKWFAHWDPASHFRFWFAISCHIWGYFMPSLLISAVKIQI